MPSDPSLRAVEGDDPWTRSLQSSPVKESHRRTGEVAPKRTSKSGTKAPRAPTAAPQPKPKKRFVNLDNWFNESEEEEDEPVAAASRSATVPATNRTSGSDDSSEDDSEEEEGSVEEDESLEEEETESETTESDSVSASDSSEESGADSRPAASSQPPSNIPTEGIANLSLDSERPAADKGSWSSDDEEAAVPIRPKK